MAQVDFSNAKIESLLRTMDASYLGLDRADLYHSSRTQINSNGTYRIIADTTSKLSVQYTGVFIASGTECYIMWQTTDLLWKISDITFDVGDTYDFQIDVDITVS